MFINVHHVTYVVESVQKMADYLERNFGLQPDRTDEATDLGIKSIRYRIGPTMVDFFEPLMDDATEGTKFNNVHHTTIAGQLKATGPGVMHVAWAVEGIDQICQDLKDNGNEIQQGGVVVSPFDYKIVTIEPSSAHGIYFQLAEGEVS
jgi:catechol 2,3-dioxygenase-like lactoylglutathione lyase family enzyme